MPRSLGRAAHHRRLLLLVCAAEDAVWRLAPIRTHPDVDRRAGSKRRSSWNVKAAPAGRSGMMMANESLRAPGVRCEARPGLDKPHFFECSSDLPVVLFLPLALTLHPSLSLGLLTSFRPLDPAWSRFLSTTETASERERYHPGPLPASSAANKRSGSVWRPAGRSMPTIPVLHEDNQARG
jgi:hypothetical protein